MASGLVAVVVVVGVVAATWEFGVTIGLKIDINNLYIVTSLTKQYSR